MNILSIKWINGLKGAMALWIVIFHYLLAFACFGYIGWNAVPTTAEAKVAYYWQYFPYSILTNGSFPLFIFFAIIGFLPAYKFFITGKSKFIKEQALVRYFRFLPYVLGGCFLSYVLMTGGYYYNEKVGALLGNTWDTAIFAGVPFGFMDVLYDAFVGAFLNGSNVLTVFWCMNLIFFGSYLVYGIILCFGEARKRKCIYAILAIALYFVPLYASFLAGIIAADVIASSEKASSQKETNSGILYLLLGFVIGNFPEVLLPSWINISIPYAVGSYFFIIACYQNSCVQKLLNANLLQWLGDRTFSVIVAHPLIMFSFSAWQFLYLHRAGYGYEASLTLTYASAILPNVILIYTFDKIVASVSKMLGAKIKTLL